MYRQILAQYDFLTLWDRFVAGLVGEHFGDYLAAHFSGDSLSGGKDHTDRRTLWAVEHLHGCGWQVLVPGQSLSIMLPEAFVVDPFGNAHPLTHTVFVGFKGYPDLPGIPFPVALLFELLSCPRPAPTLSDTDPDADPDADGVGADGPDGLLAPTPPAEGPAGSHTP